MLNHSFRNPLLQLAFYHTADPNNIGMLVHVNGSEKTSLAATQHAVFSTTALACAQRMGLRAAGLARSRSGSRRSGRRKAVLLAEKSVLTLLFTVVFILPII